MDWFKGMGKNSKAFLLADLAAGNPANNLIELAKPKKKNVVAERLNCIDACINSAEILKNVIYVSSDCIDPLLTVNMIGDVLRHNLNIVAALADPRNNILIDEIDNDLHYSACKKLWEAIFALAIDTNKQVFVTTYSKETLYRLNEMLEEYTDIRMRYGSIRLKTLNENGIRPIN